MTLLALDALCVRYGGIDALRDVTLHVDEGEVVALIGANGAGKSTTIRAISGLVAPLSGSVSFDGEDVTKTAVHRRVTRGIAECPEGRRVLGRLSVTTNLELGAYTRRDRAHIAADLQTMFELFPILADRRSQLAGTLSGGEQQMLAMARAMMSRPRLLLLDEPSLGLAPLVVRQILTTIEDLRSQGVTILLVEQNAGLAMDHADRAYVLDAGQVVLSGVASELAADPRLQAAYLGEAAAAAES
jgi:branched-chain amino acid transport system ATP-binding protein